MTTATLDPTPSPTAAEAAAPPGGASHIAGPALPRLRPARGDRPELRLYRLLRAARGRLRLRRRPRAADARDDRGPRRRASGAISSCCPSTRRRRGARRGLDGARRRGTPRRGPRDRAAAPEGRHPQPDAQLQGPGRRGGRRPGRRVRLRHDRLRLDRQPRRRDRGRRGRGRAARLRLRPVRPRAGEDRPRPELRRDGRPRRRHVRRHQPARPRDRRRGGLGASSTSTSGRSTPRAARRSRSRSPSSSAGGCPDVVVGPIASGSLFTKVAKGFDELAQIGLVERKEVRFVGGQPAGCSPVATAFANGRRDRPGPARPTRSSARSRSARRPTAAYAIELATRTGGSIEAVDGRDHRGDDPARGGDARASSSRPPAA